MERSGVITLVLVMVAACGDGAGVKADAGPPDAGTPDGPSVECWPNDGLLPKGSLTLGTGLDTFVPMPDELQLQLGVTGGYSVIANLRMSGLAPGNLQNILDPGNPRTRLRAFFADDNVAVNDTWCPFRFGYLLSGDAYQPESGVGIPFDICWHSDQLFNRRIRIEAQIVDASGGFATAVKTVTLVPPTWVDPMDAGLPGCSM